MSHKHCFHWSRLSDYFDMAIDECCECKVLINIQFDVNYYKAELVKVDDTNEQVQD